jgi:hypothetical protein
LPVVTYRLEPGAIQPLEPKVVRGVRVPIAGILSTHAMAAPIRRADRSLVTVVGIRSDFQVSNVGNKCIYTPLLA